MTGIAPSQSPDAHSLTKVLSDQPVDYHRVLRIHQIIQPSSIQTLLSNSLHFSNAHTSHKLGLGSETQGIESRLLLQSSLT